jgi:hypothetical protein
MVKQWAQPPINKHRLPPGGFLLGPHLTSFFLNIYIIIYIRFSLEYQDKSSKFILWQ